MTAAPTPLSLRHSIAMALAGITPPRVTYADILFEIMRHQAWLKNETSKYGQKRENRSPD